MTASALAASFDWRALDRRSARTGSALSALVLEHSPVVFGCRYTPEDMVVLDLIGRYRFPVRVIAWDAGLAAEESKAFADFMARRYVFATPVMRVRDERAMQSRGLAADVDSWERLAVTFTGCRGWITASRAHGEQVRQVEIASGDAAHRLVRVAPLADWTDDEVCGYLQRWELPYRVV